MHTDVWFGWGNANNESISMDNKFIQEMRLKYKCVETKQLEEKGGQNR